MRGHAGHSSKTFDSGLYRGNPTPDWYHYEGWPLRWGMGILQGIEEAKKSMNRNTYRESAFKKLEDIAGD